MIEIQEENDRHGAEGPAEHLHRAEHDLEQALEKSREAACDVAKAEAEVEKTIEEIEHAHQFKIQVLYNGVDKTFEVRPEETVKHLLDQAISAFGAAAPHTLSLYKDGTELADAETMKAAGVKPGDKLLLRPSKVKGG
jgi:hypothetical protein